MIRCKNCGADMRFDIDRQLLVCDYCDSVENVVNIQKTDITSEEQVMEAVVHTCPSCGAELYTTEDTAATFCSYCGSSVLLESRMVLINKPDYIIPFSIDREKAQELYRKKLSKAVFAPSDIKKAEIESIRGIYMPYWEYFMKDNSKVNFMTKTNKRREGDYVLEDMYEITYRQSLESDGLEYDASSKFPDDLSQACAPYYFKGSRLFNPGYMSGFYADLGDVPYDTYLKSAAGTVKEIAAEEVLSHTDLEKYGAEQENIEAATKIKDVKAGMAMYPVWFACARDTKEKYINYAVINGQTGKVSADLPVDKKKIILGTVIFAVPIFLLLYFLFTPNPVATVVIVGILSIVGTLIGINKTNDLIREDAGAGLSKKKPPAEDKKKMDAEKKKMRLRMYAAIAICIIVIIFAPVEDIFYYIAAVAAGVLCGWTYLRIFELHNRGIERPLPQLEKRGGDGA